MKPPAVSFIMPVFNSAPTVIESVQSIFEGNFDDGDEMVVVDDGSTDNSASILRSLARQFSSVTVVEHKRNKGGGAARNTALDCAQHSLVFCLDSDNILQQGSVSRLRRFLVESNADAAAFQELRYFRTDTERVSQRWVFRAGQTTLADHLSGPVVPGSSGNYLFTRDSWLRAGGYPESAGALDAWGFAFRQLATGSRLLVMPDSYYYHRYGHESYWVRHSRESSASLTALKVLTPFLGQISAEDVDYIMSAEHRLDWFENLSDRPLRVRGTGIGKPGVIRKPGPTMQALRTVLRKLRADRSNE